MSLFGGKGKDGTKEFDEMRRALGSAEKSKENDPVTQGSAGRGGEAGQSGRPSASTASPDTPSANQAPSQAPNQSPKAVPTPAENCSSVVSAGSTWQGTLKMEGSVRVEGHLSGEIEAGDTVHVAESARVDAKVQAAFVVIAGTFQGEVQCSERLELMPTSRINGELTTKSLMIHEGAFIDGQIHMSGSKPSAGQAKPLSSASAKTSEPATTAVPPA